MFRFVYFAHLVLNYMSQNAKSSNRSITIFTDSFLFCGIRNSYEFFLSLSKITNFVQISCTKFICEFAYEFLHEFKTKGKIRARNFKFHIFDNYMVRDNVHSHLRHAKRPMAVRGGLSNGCFPWTKWDFCSEDKKLY